MQQTTMQALIKKQPGKGLWMGEVPVPVIGARDVLIKVKKTGICGTDMHIYNWDAWSQKIIKTPMVIGHEFVGEIVEIGSESSGFKLGDLVSAEGHIVCGRCRNCQAGRRHLCINTIGLGVHRDGAFAEYVSVPINNVWHCAPDIPLELFAAYDPLGNAVHTTLAFDLVGEDVLITGAGPIGVMAVAIAKHAGARYVVITDVNNYRLDMAKAVGADIALNVAEDLRSLQNIMQSLGMNEGFDVALEMSGSSAALPPMLEAMSHGGKIAMLGIQPEDTAIDWDAVVFKGLTIKGIYGRKMYETWYKLTAMLQSGLDVNSVITHNFSYKDFQEAFDLMNSGQTGKVILDWEE